MKCPPEQSGELWRRWQKTAARRPRASLLVDAATHREYCARAITAAAEMVFCHAGFDGAGNCVAWVLPNGVDWLAIFLAAQKAGWAALPLDPGFETGQGWKLAAQLGATHWWDGQNLTRLQKNIRRWRGVAVAKVTSGSTGQASVVPCQARHLLADYQQLRAGMGLRPRDKNLGLIPWGHSYGLGNLVLPLLVDGLPIVSAASYTISQIREWCERHGPTVFPSVPAVFKLLAESVGSNRLGRLRLVISAGAVLPAEVVEAFERRFGRRIHNFYGASETGGICYDRTGQASRSGRSVGPPLPGVTITFRAGQVGVQSAAVATPSGKHILPDCGSWNGVGEVVLTGRVGRQANLAGRKVSPTEIEATLRAFAGVTDAWCGVGVRAGRDFLATAVETAESIAVLKKALLSRLPIWKQPRVWLALPEFPRTARGKIDVQTLEKQLGM